MNKKLLFTTILVFFFIIISISTSIGLPEQAKIPDRAKMKGIVVIAPNVTPSDIPYDTEFWKGHFKKILGIVGPEAKVARNSPNYAYAIIDIPPGIYNKTVDSLREMGYYVRDEMIGRLQLDESVSAIKGPYQWNDDSGSHTLTGANRIITILDTGIDCTHPDFNDCILDNSGKILAWYDAFDLSSTPVDLNGHGTYVASIAAGTGAASGGKFKGVAPSAGLKVGRVCDAIGQCLERYVAEGIDWAIASGTDVISMSLGFPQHATEEKCTGNSVGPERDIFEALRNAGIVVAGAGNEGVRKKSIDFPACIDNVIAVGATLKKDYNKYEYLNYDGWDGTTPVHVIVKVNGIEEYNKEWEARSDKGTGAQFIVYPRGCDAYTGARQCTDAGCDWECIGFEDCWCEGTPTKANILVAIEGKWKYRCPVYNEGWDPGGGDKGDAFWEWRNSLSIGSGKIGVEIATRPIYEVWNGGICFQTYWNNTYGTIDVRMFQSNEGLKDRVLLWSGKGPAPQGTNKPDVAAPGAIICAARASGTAQRAPYCGDDNYVSGSGTSAATPHVAGLVVLLREANPSASLDNVKNALTQADKNVNDIHLEGFGRINIQKAVDYLTDCNLKFEDGWYCNGDIREYRDHYYDNGYCTYSLTQSENCKDYGSTYYCSNGYCYSSGSSGGGGGGGGRPVMMLY